MFDDLKMLLTTQATLGQILPLVVMVGLLALAATRATARRATPQNKRTTTRPTPLARAEAWLTREGIGPFWRIMFWLTATAFVGLFGLAIAAAFVLVGGTIFAEPSHTPTTSLGLGALLVALLGAPFLIWRSVVAQNTLDTARKEAAMKEEALFNDKINAAAKDLAARRQVTRVVIQDGKETILTEWEDDLVTRAAAIDRLEGLAIDAINRDDYPPAQRIARMLSIYVQEYSRVNPPMISQDKEGRILSGFSWSASPHNVNLAAERAAQSLGQINPKDNAARTKFDPINSIDLRGCNLQRFNLTGSNFSGAMLREARLDGSLLNDARFEDAILIDVGMVGVSAARARFDRSGLGVDMTLSILTKATFYFVEDVNQSSNGKDGRYAIFDRAQLLNATIRFQNNRTIVPYWRIGVDFSKSLTNGCLLKGFNVHHEHNWPKKFHYDHHAIGLAFRNCTLTENLLSRCHLPICFGDGSVTLPGGKGPDSPEWPAHWPKTILSDAEFTKRLATWRKS